MTKEEIRERRKALGYCTCGICFDMDFKAYQSLKTALQPEQPQETSRKLAADGKSFFDFSDEEKKEILEKAAKEANEAQRKFMEDAPVKRVSSDTRSTGQHTEDSVPWEEELIELDNTYGIIDTGGGDELEVKTKILKTFIRDNFISKKELEKIYEKGHGGGNWRRLILTLLNKGDKE